MITNLIFLVYFFLGMQSGTIYGANAWGIGLKEKLLPQYLKKAGYKTHAIGKVFPRFIFYFLILFE